MSRNHRRIPWKKISYQEQYVAGNAKKCLNINSTRRGSAGRDWIGWDSMGRDGMGRKEDGGQSRSWHIAMCHSRLVWAIEQLRVFVSLSVADVDLGQKNRGTKSSHFAAVLGFWSSFLLAFCWSWSWSWSSSTDAIADAWFALFPVQQ